MLTNSQRYLLIIALLLVGVGLTWGQRLSSLANVPVVPTPSPDGEPNPTTPTLEHTYFVDIEGWYRITPYETVVRSPYDLSAESTEAMAAAIPGTVGEWQQAGPDAYIGDDEAVVFYLKQPTVALQRTYQNPAGQKVTLVLIGNKGKDSFLLFSHTPETCYPGRLWQVIERRQESALLDDQPMYAQYLLTEHAPSNERLLVLFWYLWENPQRDPEEGVLSIRVNVRIPPGGNEEAALEQAWDFVRELFPTTVPWERF
jgi:hypothetical protein